MPGVDVSRTAHEGHREIAHAHAQRRGDEGRGALFDHLLVPSLDGALALEEVDGVAVLVGQDLDLDVAGPLDHLLHVDPVVAKGALGFAAGTGRGRDEVAGRGHEAHALASAPRRRLQHHREPEGAGLARDGGVVRERLQGPGTTGSPGGHRRAPGGGLLPEEGHGVAAGADEDEPRRGTVAREVGVLGEEAVAGVDGIGAARSRAACDHAVGPAGTSRGRGRRPEGRRSSAMRTWSAPWSASECTATGVMPISRQARMTRTAISPRFAIRILRKALTAQRYAFIAGCCRASWGGSSPACFG